MITIKILLQNGKNSLINQKSSELDSEILLSHILNKPIAWIYANFEYQPSEYQCKQYAKFINKRQLGKPIEYITGCASFWSLDLLVTEKTLIPRPETELLVEQILQNQQNKLTVLDIGCGTGAIAIALATERPLWKITAVDICKDALEVCNKNILQNNVQNITTYESDVFSALKAKQKFDVIVSNPPYLADDDVHLSGLQDPQKALVAKNNGMEILHKIIAQAGQYLNNDGLLLFEHGYLQSQQVTRLLADYNFINITTKKDLQGWDRITYAKKPTS